MNTSWLFLAGAIAFELVATTWMKMSENFSKLLPTIGMYVGYLISYTLLAFSLKRIDVSVAYAVWSAVGTVVIAVIGICMFKEQVNAMKVISILFIVLGVIGLNLSGVSH